MTIFVRSNQNLAVQLDYLDILLKNGLPEVGAVRVFYKDVAEHLFEEASTSDLRELVTELVSTPPEALEDYRRQMLLEMGIKKQWWEHVWPLQIAEPEREKQRPEKRPGKKRKGDEFRKDIPGGENMVWTAREVGDEGVVKRQR